MNLWDSWEKMPTVSMELTPVPARAKGRPMCCIHLGGREASLLQRLSGRDEVLRVWVDSLELVKFEMVFRGEHKDDLMGTLHFRRESEMAAKSFPLPLGIETIVVMYGEEP